HPGRSAHRPNHGYARWHARASGSVLTVFVWREELDARWRGRLADVQTNSGRTEDVVERPHDRPPPTELLPRPTRAPASARRPREEPRSEPGAALRRGT